jgi:enamine deaminase RidA (YjgF/YER057c/UK114 family)
MIPHAGRARPGLSIPTLCVALSVIGANGDAQETYPLAGTPYSAGVESPAGATLAVLGSVVGQGVDAVTAARSALAALESRLEEVGLGKQHVLRVRAALAPEAGDGSEFMAWNQAWTAFFDSGHLPARTTLGASALPGDARIVLDVVAAFPPAGGYPAQVAGARETPNPHIRLAGPASNPTAIVSTQSGLFLSSGALPRRDADASSMEGQMRSSMNQLAATLADHGLRWHDVFFVRVLPTPQPDRPSPDFEAWSPVYASLGRLAAGHAPAYTMWASPGFGASGRFVEIEVWAAPPGPQATFATLDRESANPLLVMSGSPTSAIASGATIAPNAELIWISGVVAPDGTPPDDEAAAALGVMKERLAAMGVSMADVAELRVYRVADDGGDELSSAWNDAYGAEFNTEQNPHKPVRTNYLVESLPGGRHVEVEAIIVRSPGVF